MTSGKIPTAFKWGLGVLCVAIGCWAWNWIGAGHTRWVSAAAFSRDGSLLITAAGNDKDAEIILWDVETRRKVSERKVESGRPKWIWFSAEDQQVVVSCDVAGKSITDYQRGEITVLSPDLKTEITSFREPDYGDSIMPLDQTGKLVEYDTKLLQVRGVVDSERTSLVSNGDTFINGVGVSRNEHYLGAGCGGVARVWDLQTQEELPPLYAPEISLRGIAISNDGNFVAATQDEYSWNTTTFELVFWDRKQGATPLAEASAAVGDEVFRDRKQGETPLKVVQFKRAVTTLQYIPGDALRLLVVSGKNHAECEVSLYDTSGELLQKLYEGNASVDGVDVTPDGTRLVWVDSSGKGELWSLNGAEPIRMWQQQMPEMRWLKFSPDTLLLAGHGYNEDVWLFDPSTGKKATTLEGYRTSDTAVRLFSILPMFLMFAALQWYRQRAAKNREDCMTTVAQRLDWQHTSGSLPEGISEFDFFTKRSGGTFEHVLLGQSNDVKTLLAVYAWIERSDDHDTPLQDLCVIYPHMAKDVPDLFIRPESLADKLAEYVGFTDVDLDGSETLKQFSKRHVLRTRTPLQMTDVINESFAEFLCEHEGWNIEVLDGSVLLRWQRVKSFSSSRFPADEPEGVIAFVEESRIIMKLLVEPDENLRA